MFKNLWTTAIAGIAGFTLLLTPGISEAQRRTAGGGGGGSVNRGSVGSYNGRGYDNRGRGYYPGYGGIGIGLGLGYGLGYPGYYNGGSPYYYSNSGTYYADPGRNSYYPSETTQYYSSGTMANQLQNPNGTGFIVRVPDPNAEVWFQDYRTQQTGMVRHFESGQLDPNMTYTFTIRVRWNQNGQPMDQTRQINARAGQNQLVDFTTQMREQVPTLPQRQ